MSRAVERYVVRFRLRGASGNEGRLRELAVWASSPTDARRQAREEMGHLIDIAGCRVERRASDG